jgi:carboxypeptidase Q
MEVMRILKALDVPLRRTVRAGLWDAEEQCLCGSRGYVRKHFADPVTMELKPAHAKLSAYFNLDNGSGKIRGVYLQQNDMARPIFEAWMAPFADLGVTTATIVNTSGTDHLSFNAVGLPGFQFVQDPLDYDLNTHHSIVDDVGHVSPGDLMQAAAVMATAVYHAAQREGLMPRKPLPAPLPPKNELPEILRD